MLKHFNVAGAGCNEENPWQCSDYDHLEGKPYNANDCTTCNQYILRQAKLIQTIKIQ